MGDRTIVQITVLASQAEQTFDILKEYQHFPNNWDYEDVKEDDDYSFSYEDLDSKLELIVFTLSEVNYANVDSESFELCGKGIAHDVTWESGCTYDAGRNLYRFDANGVQQTALELNYDGVPTVNAIMLLDQLNTKSVEEVRADLQKIIDESKGICWSKQQEYGQLHVNLKGEIS
jgi:hypothetical protein